MAPRHFWWLYEAATNAARANRPKKLTKREVTRLRRWMDRVNHDAARTEDHNRGGNEAGS